MAAGVFGFEGSAGSVFGVFALSAEGASRAAVTAPPAFKNSRRPCLPVEIDSLLLMDASSNFTRNHHKPKTKHMRLLPPHRSGQQGRNPSPRALFAYHPILLRL